MFISAVPVGWRIRDNKMSLCSFLCEDPAKKKKNYGRLEKIYEDCKLSRKIYKGFDKIMQRNSI